MRILGIDPGSRATGYGVIEVSGSRLRRIAGGVVRPSVEPLAERLGQIANAIEGVIQSTRPEQSAFEAVFASRNARSALLLGQARGAALAVCGRAGLGAAEYAPSRVKQAVVGHGGAAKSQVQLMVQRLLGLESAPPTDEADALAVAICHAHTGRVPGQTAVPHTRARSTRAAGRGARLR